MRGTDGRTFCPVMLVTYKAAYRKDCVDIKVPHRNRKVMKGTYRYRLVGEDCLKVAPAQAQASFDPDGRTSIRQRGVEDTKLSRNYKVQTTGDRTAATQNYHVRT